MRSTLTELSARLAIRARLPALLMDRPDGCLPTSTVSISFGGVVVRSITHRRLSGTCLNTPFSLTTLSEFATMARVSSGVIARFTGGPAMVLGNGRLMMIFGASGSVPMSMIDRVSLPAALRITLPSLSQASFSSLATIISSRFPAGATLAQPARWSAASAVMAAMMEVRKFTGFSFGLNDSVARIDQTMVASKRTKTPRVFLQLRLKLCSYINSILRPLVMRGSLI